MKPTTIASLDAPLRTETGSYLGQKDVSNLRIVTSRQVRPWERQAEKEGRPFTKPYSRAALARMFMMRRTHCWSRAWAEHLGSGGQQGRLDPCPGARSGAGAPSGLGYASRNRPVG